MRRIAMRLAIGLALAVALALVAPAGAQPYGAWFDLTGYPATHGYVQIAHQAALNPTGAFTFEAWVAISNNVVGEDCRSIAGKNYLQAWWIGVCNIGGEPTLRSYLKGGASSRNGGIVPRNVWTHVAVTFDGAHRRHYINGELAAEFAETGPLASSTSALRIGSDVSWEHSPDGAIDELRLWNVARSVAQLREKINERITTAQAGLVGVWSLDGNGNDVVGPYDGALGGNGRGFLTFPVAPNCGAGTATSLCLLDRFLVTAKWRTNPAPGSPIDGTGQVVSCANDGSGLFWFFSATNWEILVKALNGCGLNNRYWVFSAATTNVFYRMEVLDVRAGAQKIFFNYPGPPAPAVTDVNAFATCP